uniref:NADH-ubiquinone oxidoreductase chain 6 n=1 Tax=Scherffelia dubia TaxID=3190 RepID=A0A650ARB0_SCHDU|nr:NADH dehydrogenase subunit 6 [Scherffelia dubia]QGP70672.1 NADH dehydrogenase subunit 6 [Scherffelia dubia]
MLKMNILFFIFASIAVMSGIMVIQSRNPVHSVLFLILVFFNAAALLILVGLDFFAMVLVVVYVGAIAVLFLFVVMMLNIKLTEIHEQKLRYLPIGGLIGILFLFEIFVIIDNDIFFYQWSMLPFVEWSSLIQNNTNIKAIGQLIYTYFFYDFILASLILLVAMIGAIVLTMHRGAIVKSQNIFEQNLRDFSKTITKKETFNVYSSKNNES